jgi:hypothetical protein
MIEGIIGKGQGFKTCITCNNPILPRPHEVEQESLSESKCGYCKVDIEVDESGVGGLVGLLSITHSVALFPEGHVKADGDIVQLRVVRKSSVDVSGLLV